MFRTALTSFFTGRGKSLAYAGTAIALTGAGVATAAAASPASSAPQVASAARQISVGDDAGVQQWPAAGAGQPAARTAAAKPAGAPSRTTAAHAPRARRAPRAGAARPTAHAQAGHAQAGHAHAGHHAAPHRTSRAAARARVHVVKHASHPTTWKHLRDMLAAQTEPKAAPGKLPLADRLQPGPASGPQAFMPITVSRLDNATTIVRQTLAKHMGVRSAVIAVATAMQESTLENIDYGDRDSLGLFQQRPSCGWGSPAQITDPAYAADAFLDALHSHQKADPDWAGQPLWENAQAVQDSGFPYAYAKWESQAAQLVSSIAKHLA